MGKWSTYRRRGTAPMIGTLTPPTASMFTVGTPTATTIPFTFTGTIPVPANAIRLVVMNNATNVNVTSPIVTGSSTITGLTTGTTYRVLAQWWITTAGGASSAELVFTATTA